MCKVFKITKVSDLINRILHTSNYQLNPTRILRGLERRAINFPHLISWFRNPEVPRSLVPYRGIHAKGRCFILGNGPSLAITDIERLNGEITFGLNRIYLLFEERNFHPTYFVSINDLVLEQSVPEISALTMPKFLNWRARHLYPQAQDVHYLLERYKPGFYTDPRKGVWGGATVTYVALQLAFYMGFETVILVGVDHSFYSKGVPHTVVSGGASDSDHFHPKYFADGTRWQLPDLQTSEYAYRLANQVYESAGRRVLDATIGGKLKIFPKVDFDDVVRA